MIRGYVVIADMSRTPKLRKALPDDIHVISERESGVASLGVSLLIAKGLPVAFVYSGDDLSDKRVLIDHGRPVDVPFIVLGSSDDNQTLIGFFGE